MKEKVLSNIGAFGVLVQKTQELFPISNLSDGVIKGHVFIDFYWVKSTFRGG